ncbi:MAG: MerR family transcriptional regulator [Brachybacterium sp.]
MRIGDVASRAGVSPRALRYYEEQGLLSSERSAGGQRTYPASAVERVRLIQTFFAAGLSSRTVLQLLPCVDSGTGSPEALELLAQERQRITETVADLHAARDALDELIVNASHPTPEHCPGLREPAWSTYEGAPVEPARA